MVEPTSLSDYIKPLAFINTAIKAITSADVDALLSQLPIIAEGNYTFREQDPEFGWRPGYFHWIPVGGDRGNAGRIKLANQPVNPIAERGINGIEAILELARQRELQREPGANPPTTPREAVRRYFSLPPL